MRTQWLRGPCSAWLVSLLPTPRRRTLPERVVSMRSGSSSCLDVLDYLERHPIDWNNRLQLQSLFQPRQVGWQVPVEWKHSRHGTGVFSTKNVPRGTLLRVGQVGQNLVSVESVNEIEQFCRGSIQQQDDIYQQRLLYVKDYLWGLYRTTDDWGYPLADSKDDRFFGFWIPGNGLNHANTPNTVYKIYDNALPPQIHLVALTDIAPGDELFDDYRRHGPAPDWLKEFAVQHNVTLNFGDCNDFVQT
jgi:SET domain